MLLGVEKAVEVDARRPLVLGLQDSLCIVQPNPLDVLGELTVGAYQLSRSDAQPTLGCVDLFDERVVGHLRLPASGALTVDPDPSPDSVRTLAGQHHGRYNKWRRLTGPMTEAKNGLIVHSPLL